MNSINSAFLYQKTKLKTAVLNSEYSFVNPNFIDEEFNKDDHLECLKELYNELREGMIGIKLDSFNLIANMEWRAEYNKKPREDYYFSLCKEIANDFFKIRSGQLYIDGNEKEYSERYDYISSSNSKSLEVGSKTNNKFQWYILKQMMDVDVLIGAYLISKGLTNISDMVLWDTLLYTTDSLLEKVLEKGTAELHMHVGASKSFTALWTTLMNRNFPKTNSKSGKNKGQSIFAQLKNNYSYGKINFEKSVYLFRLLRILLAMYLREYKRSGIIKDFSQFIEKVIDDEMITLIISKVLRHIQDEEYSFDEDDSISIEAIQEAIYRITKKFDLYLGMIKKGDIDDSYEGEVMLWESNLVHNSHIDTPYEGKGKATSKVTNAILSEDILTGLFEEFYHIKNEDIILKYKFQGIVLPEQALVFEAMKYIDNNSWETDKDQCFKKLFWHYVKFKNIVYRQIVQGPSSGKGLDTFQDFYKRQSLIEIKNYIYESFYSQTKSQNIKKFEIRLGISSDKEAVVKLLMDIFQQYKRVLKEGGFGNGEYKEVPLMGIVFHFIKRKDKNKDKCAYDDELKNNCLDYLFNQQKEYLQQAKIIGELRCNIDLLDYYLVGVDTASKENEAEPYAFREAFNYLRSIDAIKNRNSRKGSYLKQIGFTNHVGEEFRDLLSGLRHIDETIELFNYKSADRLGHAIALGINIDKWAEFNQVVCINAGEYLDNLLWQWNLLIEEKIDLDSISLLEQRIYDAVEYIFGFTESVNVRELYKAYYMKLMNKGCYTNVVMEKDRKVCALQKYTKKKYYIMNEPCKGNAEFVEDDFNNIIWSSQMIYKAMQCKYFIKELDKNVTINIDKDTIENYKRIQEIMIKKIGDRQIIVETNPTSNLIIGEFKSFEDYYISNLSSPEKEKVIVTINTDDPVVFDTRINNEYALIYDIMMRKGDYSSKEVIDWLDKLRKNSLDYSFIKDRNLRPEEIVNEIDYIYNQLANYL